uniref:MATH and LRR domain-containing protein PFE0570w-like n=1 Tax=Nicotiana tabacum TaxID=4097 RepID=A0A1S4B965_TOBAC|nr:PREDICTED: MATH and LRR domain-containing protein PFE0570w-like [Nicotiana tabacum]
MIAVKIPDAAVKTGKSEQSELFLKLKLRNESERSHEDAERVKTDTCPANTETSKSENDDQSAAEDISKAYQSENVDALIAKIQELKKEICTFSCVLKKSAKSCMRLKRENKNLLQELKQKYSKDEISKLESMNPDGKSQSLEDDDEEQYQTSSESSSEFNSSPDCYSDDDDDDGDSDSLPLLQLKSKQTTPVNE